jgi:hypothetical protein
MRNLTEIVRKAGATDFDEAFGISKERWKEISIKIASMTSNVVLSAKMSVSLADMLIELETVHDLKPRDEGELIAISFAIGCMWKKLVEDAAAHAMMKELGIDLRQLLGPRGEEAPDTHI